MNVVAVTTFAVRVEVSTFPLTTAEERSNVVEAEGTILANADPSQTHASFPVESTHIRPASPAASAVDPSGRTVGAEVA
jgi:hypothetical protein